MTESRDEAACGTCSSCCGLKQKKGRWRSRSTAGWSLSSWDGNTMSRGRKVNDCKTRVFSVTRGQTHTPPNERAEGLKATPTRWSWPGGGIGTRASLAANSFTLSSTSAKRHDLSWSNRLQRQKARETEIQAEISSEHSPLMFGVRRPTNWTPPDCSAPERDSLRSASCGHFKLSL